jgi:hypothetical protein
MELIKNLYKKYNEATGTFGDILLIILFFYVLSSYNNSPLERFIKLGPDQRADRVEALNNVDSMIDQCKQLNRRYTRQKEYQGWYEDIYSFGEWYEPRLSNPVIKVTFINEEGGSYNPSYCEVNLVWLEYEFYELETFELGEDQYGNVHSETFKKHMCDDMYEENPCTK